MGKIKERGYIQSGYVKFWMRCFLVSKGYQDTRMVYYGVSSGFNDLVWVNNFGLPSGKTLIFVTLPTSWVVDLDIGEMVLNVMLDLDANKYVVVDGTNMLPGEMYADQRDLWLHWYRCEIGLKHSPNHTTQAILLAEKFLLGNPPLMRNPFQYSSVCINLPGTGEYKPGKYWHSVIYQEGELASIL